MFHSFAGLGSKNGVPKATEHMANLPQATLMTQLTILDTTSKEEHLMGSPCWPPNPSYHRYNMKVPDPSSKLLRMRGPTLLHCFLLQALLPPWTLHVSFFFRASTSFVIVCLDWRHTKPRLAQM